MLRGIIFDMDGTLTKPNVDFAAIEREIGQKVGFIIDYAERSSPEERARALEILERHEAKSALEPELNEGVLEMLEVVSKKKLKKALLTRNSANQWIPFSANIICMCILSLLSAVKIQNQNRRLIPFFC